MLINSFTIKTKIILIILMLSNAIWIIFSEYRGPLIALIFYAVITLFCWQKKDFKAGIIAGVLGFGIHLYELLFRNISELEGIDAAFFSINLILPILLIYFSYKAYKNQKDL